MYILLTLLYYTYYGLFAIVVAPSLQVSSVACTIFYALWNLFSGVLITLPEIPVSHHLSPCRLCQHQLKARCFQVRADAS